MPAITMQCKVINYFPISRLPEKERPTVNQSSTGLKLTCDRASTAGRGDFMVVVVVAAVVVGNSGSLLALLLRLHLGNLTGRTHVIHWNASTCNHHHHHHCHGDHAYIVHNNIN